ncbi:MAG: PAS domain-containing protein, partial [Anaerolineaceae bacterium]|nr:PAS domain-containing protein [Anaerolineaceae bacterium]
MKKVPKAVCKVVEKQLHINQIRMMGLVSEGKHFGGIVVISEGDLSIYTTAIESVVYQATQVIKRLRAEKVRALSEARLRSTFDAIEDGYWDWDIETGQIETNDKWFTMLGFNPNEFPATYENFIKLVHPQDINNIIQQIEAAQSDHDRQYNIEYRLRMKSGDYKYIQSRGKFIRIVGDEKPIRMVGTHTDISDRKRLEEDRLLFFDTQRKLLQVTTLEELNDLVGNCLIKLIQNGFVTISKVDELSRTTKVVGFFGFSGAIEELLNRYRLSISSFATRLDEIEPEDLKMWQSNTLVKYEKGIYGIVNKKIPKKICQLIEKNLGINEINVMGCQLKNNDFGGFVLLTKNGLGQNRELIETLINDTAIAIQR